MKINFKVTSPMGYFWLKRVTGIALSNHCARCLTGDYFKGIDAKSTQGEYDLRDGLYYLCGVSRPYNWHRNFHLAFVSDPQSDVRVNYNGVDVAIAGARQISFSEDDINPTDTHIGDPSYRTCRNWQFAHWLSKHQDEVL